MTRLSEYLLPTEKQAPADAEAISHKLMVRAGLVRQMGAGMWTWLPAGWRVHQRVVAIIREEMDAIGAQEMLMPVLQPAEPWRRTGRLEIEELFKLTDRKGSELVLAMTHEEAVTFHVAQTVRSYRDLPLILYHFQVKERDEPRPRAGVLRTREFVMKDAYTFDRDAAGLEVSYDRHVGAYDRIMERTGLRFYRVEGDVGMMGGLGAHEYMAPCPAGEDQVALTEGYAANLEVALKHPDIREVGEGDESDDGGEREKRYALGDRELTIEPAIEIGNIFKLGTRYSEPLGANYLDEHGARAADLDGLLRDRPRTHRRRRRGAVRRRARDLLAARARAVRCAPRGPRQARHPRARCAGRAVRDPEHGGRGGALRRPRPRRWGEVRRRRAARLPAAAHRGRRSLESGEIEVQVRRGRQSAPGLPLGAAADVLVRAVDELCQSLSLSAPPSDCAPGPRPLGPAAATDCRRGSRCGRGRSPTRSVSCGSR